MIKIVSLWKRNPNLTEKECEQHYQTVHTQLARAALGDVPGFRKYVQNKVVSETVYNFNDVENPAQEQPEYDRFVELYFDDIDSFNRAMARPEMKACFEDHPNFQNVNIARNLIIWEVEETIPLKRKD